MASRNDILQGYDENRFQGQVRQDLICSICYDVLNDPRLCQNQEHPFCLACISRHLQNSPTCPLCQENLTPDTLRNPTRFFMQILLEQKINCDYSHRGCPDYVELENLQTHVRECGFAPVMCGNEGCGKQMNKRDKENHEKNLCQFRITKCHDCGDIKASQNEIKVELDQLKVSQAEFKTSQAEMETSQNEMRVELNEMKVRITEIERKQYQINGKVDQIKESVDEIKQTQDEIKADMQHEFATLTEMVTQILQRPMMDNHGAQAEDPAVPVNNQEIIIIGGWYGRQDNEILDTVEKFNVIDGTSTELPKMKHPRGASALCIHNHDLIVAGGHNGDSGTDTIERLKMNEHPLEWKLFDVKLPAKISSHAAVVYQDKLYVIGGVNWDENEKSNAMYEICLTPPHTTRLVAKMPQPRMNHRAELINDKLFILGGLTKGGCSDGVIVYDFTKRWSIVKFKKCKSLPYAVAGMSTVTWRNKIILAGGKDKDDQTLNYVIMYDTETERCEKLPSMIHKRRGCSAVMRNGVITVLGGRTEEQYLNSVESFTMGSEGWKELKDMKVCRHLSTATISI